MRRDLGVAVVGGGAWGTALAVHLARRGDRVGLWMRERDLVLRMLDRRDNPMYLPGVEIPETVAPTTVLAEAVRGAAIVLGAVPSHHARAVYREMAESTAPGAVIVVATKGIEEATLALPADVAMEELRGDPRVAVLSGPSFAAEVARGVPTAIVVASSDDRLAEEIRDLLSFANVRLYVNRDPLGVQIAGALKNVIAIAAGVLDGLHEGRNAVAALVTRGLAEIRRLGLAMGADPATFAGLAGLGDLVLTCTGRLSRNHAIGRAIGRGERLEDLLAQSVSVAEGVRTTRAARALALRSGVAMPIVDEVHRMLFEDGAPGESVARLMSRPLTAEEDAAGRPRS